MKTWHDVGLVVFGGLVGIGASLGLLLHLMRSWPQRGSHGADTWWCGERCPGPMLEAELNEAINMVEELALQSMYQAVDDEYLDLGISTFEDAADFLQRHRAEQWQVSPRGMRRIGEGEMIAEVEREP